MMRTKKLTVCLIGLLLMLLTGCASSAEPLISESAASSSSSGQGPDVPPSTEASGTGRGTTDSAGKVLVAYFSCTGTTEQTARQIAEHLDAERYEIVPQIPYTSDDLDYNNPDSRTSKEQNDASARPAISGSIPNLDEYDVIFLGFPIWWGQAPKIISTFLESGDFSGKTVVPFCTSHSSGIGSSDTNLHSLCPAAEWREGRRFAHGTAQQEIEDWLDGLELGTAIS